MTDKKREQQHPRDHKALAEKLQQYVAPRLKIKDALNSVALVTSPEGDIFESARGYADQPRAKPLIRDAQFLAGSIAKHFTAVALVTALHDQALREHKALGHSPDKLKQAIQHKLHQPLSHYLNPKDSIWNGRMPDWAKTVTLHELMTHTSGLPCFKSIDEKATDKLHKKLNCPLSEFVDLFKDRGGPWDSPQKERPFLYANSNYLLAGYVAMQVLKSDPEAFLEDFFDPLFKKLGMLNTGLPSKKCLGDLRKDPRYNRLVFAHLVDLDQDSSVRVQYAHTVAKSLGKPNFEEMFLPFASGNLVTTAADLAIWCRALCGGSPHIPAVVSEIIQAKDSHIKFERGPGYCGYGLVRHEKENQIQFYVIHGSVRGFFASAAYYPEQEICYVELTNMNRDRGPYGILGDVRCCLTPIIHDHLWPSKQSTSSKKNWLVIAGGGLAMFALYHQFLSQKSADVSTSLITPSTGDLFGFFAGLTSLIGWPAVTPTAQVPSLPSETLKIEPVDKFESNPFVSKIPRDTCTMFSAPSGAHTAEQEEAIRQDPAPRRVMQD